MTWNMDSYPEAFRILSEEDRKVAIDAANKGLESESLDENAAIKAGLAAAESGKSKAKEIDPADRIIPHSNGYAILAKDGRKIVATYGFLRSAQLMLKDMVKEGK